MRLRPFPLISLLVCAAACRGEVAWSAPDWRPERAPLRIVAASVLATEVLLEIAPRERIAAVHFVAADPRWSVVADRCIGLPVVGAEPEQLLAARPDLVLCDPFTRPETLALLAQVNVPVVTTANPGSFADIAANLRRIGAVCHLDAEAARLVATMDERLAAVRVRSAEVATFAVMNLDGALHAHGRPSLFDAVVTAAGARNLAAEHGTGPFRKLDVEAVLSWRPDVVVLAGECGSVGVVPAWLAQAPGLGLLPCVRNGRVVTVRAPLLASTSHHLVEAARELQDRLLAWGKP